MKNGKSGGGRVADEGGAGKEKVGSGSRGVGCGKSACQGVGSSGFSLSGVSPGGRDLFLKLSAFRAPVLGGAGTGFLTFIGTSAPCIIRCFVESALPLPPATADGISRTRGFGANRALTAFAVGGGLERERFSGTDARTASMTRGGEELKSSGPGSENSDVCEGERDGGFDVGASSVAFCLPCHIQKQKKVSA